MADLLTPGCIGKIYADEKPEAVVQIINMKQITVAGGSTKRVKVWISDGSLFGIGMLIDQTSAKVLRANEKGTNTIIRLNKWATNTLQSTKLCLITDLDVVSTEVTEQIGEPANWETNKPAAVKEEQAAGSSPTASKPAHTPNTSNVSSRVAGIPVATPPPVIGNLSAARAVPITALNPYSSKWLIKVRVSHKGDLRTYNSANGQGAFFSMDLCDESGEIRATVWREAADRLFSVVEVGKVYLLSRGQLKLANKKFSTLNNQYELHLGLDTQLMPCEDDASAMLPSIHFNFTSIADIATRPANATVDVIGVVNNVTGITRLTSKTTGRELVKRSMSLADDSGKSIDCTIWGEKAESFPEESGQVVAFKGMRISEWNQRSLNSLNSTAIQQNPEVDAAARIKDWWVGGGGSSVESLSVREGGGEGGGATRDPTVRHDFATVQEKGDLLRDDDKPEYFTVRSFVSKVSPGKEERPIWFTCCPKCSKKVIGDEASGFNCENCGWSGAEASYRYILAFLVVDSASSMFMTAFNDQAIKMLGMPANELKRMKDTNLPEYEDVLQRACWKPFLMRLRIKKESWQGVSRVKANVIDAGLIDFAAEGKLLLADINKYELPEEQAPAPVKSEAIDDPSEGDVVKSEGQFVKDEPMEM
jgi:replication factor A1